MTRNPIACRIDAALIRARSAAKSANDMRLTESVGLAEAAAERELGRRPASPAPSPSRSPAAVPGRVQPRGVSGPPAERA